MPPLALLSKASLLLAAAAIPTSRSKRPDACDSVRQQLEAAQPPNSTSPENASSPSSPARILGQDAHDCLKSLPFESERAKRFVGELRKYVEFQSTLEALRKPPDSYASDPVDILGLMEQIGRIDYKSLYDFDVDLKALFASAHDGHFSVRPCSTSIFAFQRDHGGIVSVSQDGLTLPELFVYSDLEAPMPGNASISPITEINGQAALEYLQAITRTSPSQDPDSRWNELFRSLAWNDRGGVPPNGSFIDNGGSWPGAGKTTIKFANRSSIEIETLAELSGYEDFNSSSASEVLATYCRPPTGPPDPPPPPLGPFETGIQSYPEPLLRDPHNQVTGYFLDNETAVMVVASFDGGEEPRDISRDFANVTADLVARAKASGRDKLIVDVSGNPGGSPTRLLNMFKVLFPDQFPFDALRFRRSVATDTLAKVFGALNGTEALAFGTDFAFSAMVAPDQKAGFPTALDFLGAGEAQLGVTGFTHASATFKVAPYRPEDILIMGNGFCHSSCAGFVNLMVNVGGVRTLAFGGRHQTGPMQIMGGVRGGTVLSFDGIAELVGEAQRMSDQQMPGEAPALTREELVLATENLPLPLQELPFKVGGSVNSESTHLQGQEDRPLQFEYQAADCRLFYMRKSLMDPRAS